MRGAGNTGGTGSARYCYSVWLRHLILADAARPLTRVPHCVAELGPGDSIGIGLAALLSGAEKYFALDLVKYTEPRRDLAVFEELLRLYRNRAPLPADDEFPLLKPRLGGYEFPVRLLSAERMERALSQERVARIRASLTAGGGPDSMITYCAPWTGESSIHRHSVDMIYSQAVLEHVDDLSGAYRAMRSWLKPGGLMSHQIDFTCHGKADTWDGHWTFSDASWRIVVGRRPYLLNRIPRSTHLRLLEDSGFEVLREQPVRAATSLRPASLAARFRAMSEADRTTSGTFVIAAPIDAGS
jgi:Methyltransferase domain